ncbi:DTW domain-containing protein [Thalassotalea ponticola]|uniref:tRNA-uridine aminocarboxypropyltransferase n=1 Tax=Thalassotalea ponticola TaxID=1523392 RepID=UPI0025B5BEF6|nr:DTW domain-containing protein [Thalassotalea ponticola]MDN3651289.1 DTW domain-containing protein [Thalassotalea ponticola]
MSHAVNRLYQYRKSISTREFRARGAKVPRCPTCRLHREHCICSLRQVSDSQLATALIMYDDEVLKPSNTGRLIADVIEQTHAFLWRRQDIDPELERLLNSDDYQPYVVFPKAYALPEQTVYERSVPSTCGKIPLLIFIDATWRQARKIYRKSPYLHKLPIISLSLGEQQLSQQQGPSVNGSRYQVRKAVIEGQLATAEVAAYVLQLFGDNKASQHLHLWFDVFTYQYQQGVKQSNLADPLSVARYQTFIKSHYPQP